MSHWSSIADTLQSIKRAGSYATGGVCSMPLPSLSVRGMSDHILGLPLGIAQAKDIIEIATQAPFGRGEETVVDVSVRCTWQLEPDRFVIGNPNWSNQLDTLVTHIQEDLGCGSGISVELYKLLLYEPGGFFKVRNSIMCLPY